MALRRFRLLVAVGVCSLGASPAAVAQDFQEVGFLPDGILSFAYGVSANGLVAVGYGRSASSVYEAFRWTPTGGMDGLGFLDGGTYSVALGVNTNGAVVVGYGDSSTSTAEAFRWTETGGIDDLGFISGGTYSYAFGVSADGSVVVGYGSSSRSSTEAFRWTEAGGMVGLGFMPGASYSAAFAVSADGAVVAGYGNSPSSTTEAFRWTEAGGMVGLGFQSGGTRSQAYGISADGTVVVGYGNSSQSATEAFRWTEAAGMESLGFISGGTTSRAYGVNVDGSVVVGYGNSSSSSQEAFRWTPADGMQSIRTLLLAAGVDMTGWQLTEARGVSASGNTIVGSGTNPDSRTEAWIARFGPEAGLTTPASLQQSVTDVGAARAGAMAQQHGLALPLLGDDKPMSEDSEVGVFGQAGSGQGGGYARFASSAGLAILAGVSYGYESYDSASIDNALTGALAVRYLVPGGAAWRPFAEIGGWLAPRADFEFERSYMNGAGTATGIGSTEGTVSYLFARAGVLYALARGEQLALSAELGRERLTIDGYSETFSASNPFEASVSEGTDTMSILKARVQWSAVLGYGFDATAWAAGVYGFDRDSELQATVAGVGTLTPLIDDDVLWAEYGARVGYALTSAATLDVFVNGVSGEEGIETRVHGGAGLRYRF